MGQKVTGPPGRYKPPLKFQKSSALGKHATSKLFQLTLTFSGVHTLIQSASVFVKEIISKDTLSKKWGDPFGNPFTVNANLDLNILFLFRYVCCTHYKIKKTLKSRFALTLNGLSNGFSPFLPFEILSVKVDSHKSQADENARNFDMLKAILNTLTSMTLPLTAVLSTTTNDQGCVSAQLGVVPV